MGCVATRRTVAVYVRELRQILVKYGGPLGHRRIEHLEQLRQPGTQVRAVHAGAVLQELEEDVAGLEDASVVGKQTEHDPD